MGAQLTGPWIWHGSLFPFGGTVSAQLEYLVRFALLAPSTHNSQPWLFRIRGDALELFADRSRALPISDPDDRELTISCGAALGFARIAARLYGWEGPCELIPDPRNPDLLARLRLGSPRPPDPEAVSHFLAISRRHTARLPFQGDEQVDACVRGLPGRCEGGPIVAITAKRSLRACIGTLVGYADRQLMADARLRHELAGWVRSRKAHQSDGMSLASFGFSDRLSRAVAILLRLFNLGGRTAARFEKLAATAPWLGVIATKDDNPRAWLLTGLALADILLELASKDISASFLNQPIEWAETRSDVARMFGITGCPQMLIRMGRGKPLPAAARRDARQVIGT